MINTMECAADAQSLISMSLRKIHSSRTQRGGIKLHKNLLVSYVLRNARQVYMNQKYQEIWRMQQYEEVMTVCNEIQELDPLALEDSGQEEQRGECCSSSLLAQQPASASSCSVSLQSQEPGCKDPEPSFYPSCCVEAYPVSNCDFFPSVNNNNTTNTNNNAHCNKTTVLDLDTHVVTTVENGFLHQDCCAQLQPCSPQPQPCSQSPAKKRKVDFGSYLSDMEETPDFTPCKRAKLEDCSYGSSEHLDPSNISTLISIFGSGFSGLVSRQQDLETAFCSKQALASLGAWTRAIVAF